MSEPFNWDFMFSIPTTYEVDYRARENSGICEFHDVHDPHGELAYFQVRVEQSFGWGRFRDICAECLYSHYNIVGERKCHD